MSEALPPRMLRVDENVEVLDALQRQLRRQFDVTTRGGAKEAIRLVVAEGPFAEVASDLRMPGVEGKHRVPGFSFFRK